MRTIFIFILCIGISINSFSQSSSLVISQVYVSTVFSTPAAQFQRSYVELYNKSIYPISLAGKYLNTRYCYDTFCWSTWDINALPSVVIQPGKYFLAYGSSGQSGAPVTGDYYISDLSFLRPGIGQASITNGYTENACNDDLIIDKVAWGNTECFEGSAAAPSLPDLFSALVRNNSCQDTDDNFADFSIAAPMPRSSSLPANICGLGSSPVILGGPVIADIVAVEGVASGSQSYYVSAYNLANPSGNITINISTGFELSLDNINFSTLPITLAYSGSQLQPVPIYVRVSATASVPAGATLLNGTIFHSGGGAPNLIMPVHGFFEKEYYNTKANLGLQNMGTWSTIPDGTGPSPVSFTDGHQVYHIVNQANANYSGNWNVHAPQVLIKVGDSVSPVNFIIQSGADSISSSAKIDVLDNSTLTIFNNHFPQPRDIGNNTTIDFAQAGTGADDVIKIPVKRYYNLKLTNGLKSFIVGNDTVRNDLVMDGVQNINAVGPITDAITNFNMPALIIGGNVTLLNGATFSPVNDRWRLLFYLNGTGPTQTITSNGSDILLGALRKDQNPGQIIVSPGTNLQLGGESNYSGLFLYNPATVLSLTGGTLNFIGDHDEISWGSGRLKTNGTSIGFHNVKVYPGYDELRFVDNSSVNDFTLDLDPSEYDSVIISNNIDVTGNLNLLRGKVIMRPGFSMNVLSTGVNTASSPVAYVVGKMTKTGATPFLFPVGARYKYAPLRFFNYSGSNTYTVDYKKQIYPDYTIDPATLATFPDYHVSTQEYWDVEQAISGGTVDIEFNYTDGNSLITDPVNLRMAHYDGTDWNDLGGIPDASNTTSMGKVTLTGVTAFSPFTFSGATGGVIPVKLGIFTARKAHDDVVELHWTTEQEINSKSFVVERSLNGNTWKEVIRLNAAGNSMQTKDYYATDYSPANGTNYYRIKMIDLDNRLSYSEIKNVYFTKADVVTIFPNPAKDKVTIHLPGNFGNVTAKIFGGDGRLIKTISTNQATLIVSLQDISKGIYSLIITGDKLKAIKKLIVN